MVHKTYDANRFSTLTGINAANVGTLKLAFAAPVKAVKPADVHPGQIFIGGAGVANGAQIGSLHAIDVIRAKVSPNMRHPTQSTAARSPRLTCFGPDRWVEPLRPMTRRRWK